MHLKKMIGVGLLSALMMLLPTSCGHFEPDFYVGDYENSQLINEDSTVIPCTDPRFNEFGCLHKDQLIELKNILDKCQVTVGRKKKKSIKRKIRKALKQFKEN